MIMLDEHNKIYGSLGLAEPYIVATKEGETLLLDGAKDNEPFIGLSIFGKSTQDKTTGAQLFDANQISDGFVNGVNAGESFTVSTNPSYPNAQYVKVKTTDINIIAWNLTGCVKTEPEVSGVRIRYFDAEGVSVKGGPIAPESGSSETENTDSVYILAIYGFTEEAKSKAMLNAGTTVLPWEPYTGGQPSPNPDYPQEIVSVGDDGEIGVDVYGGNLLDAVNEADADVTANGVTITNNGDGSFTVTGTPTVTEAGVFTYYVTRAMALEDGNYTLSSGIFCKIYKKDSTKDYVDNTFTFDSETDESVDIYWQRTVDSYVDGETIWPMLNVGSTALPFEPYKQPQSLIVSTPNGLPGIPVSSGGNYTDENGQQWISDEVDYRRRKYVKRTELLHITDFSNTGSVANVNGYTECSVRIAGNISADMSNVSKSLCDAFVYSASINSESFAIGAPVSTYTPIYFRLKGTLSKEEWVAKMTEISPTILFPLATPIETDLTPEQITAYQSLHTNYPTTTVMNDEGAGMKAIYKQIENGG